MNHDPLCVKTEDPYSMKTCQCDLITKVRQDQCSLCCTKAEAAIAAAEAKAHQFVAALVHSQGGEVVITFHDLLSVDRNPVLERFDNPDGSITLRALQEKP